MASFTLSAPGKIILFGEHSVVFGKTAIAASIGLRTYLKFLQQSSDHISINFETIEFEHKFPIEEINDLIHSMTMNFQQITPEMINHDEFLRLINGFVENITEWKQFEHAQKSAVISFIYLLTGIALFTKFDIKSGFDIIITSELKVGAGLGSSASFSVILCGCFFKYMRHIKGQFDNSDLEQISQWALCSERIMHGNPSGVDNCLCTFGSIVQYRKNEELVLLKFDGSTTSKYEVILVDTTVPRQTKTMVSNVRTLVDQYDNVGNKILDAMDELAKKAAESITSNDGDKLTTIKEMIRINQGLLQALGVSHPKINKVCEIAANKHFAAKLTGGGGGGYCIVIALSDDDNKEALMQDFEKAGFPSVRTTLGGPGLTVD